MDHAIAIASRLDDLCRRGRILIDGRNPSIVYLPGRIHFALAISDRIYALVLETLSIRDYRNGRNGRGTTLSIAVSLASLIPDHERVTRARRLSDRVSFK